jgi:hypothetical protein
MKDPLNTLTTGTVPEILEAFVAEVGGPQAFAKMIAMDFTEAPRGSANSVRLATAMLRLMSQTPQSGDDDDLDALEDERDHLMRHLAGENGGD